MRILRKTFLSNYACQIHRQQARIKSVSISIKLPLKEKQREES